jgi:hypothetical protein
MSIAARLNEDVDHVSVLINGAPKIVLAAADPNEDFIEVPDISSATLFPPRIGCVFAAELLAPLADRFVRYLNATLGQEIFDISEAQGEPIVEPNGVADDVGGKSISSVAR